MINIPVIARRELSASFLSPIAYLVLTAFSVANGLLFAIYIGSPLIDPNDSIRLIFWIAFYLMIVAAPIITMRLVSEETSQGTLEPLLTAPVSDTEVILGKFAGALFFCIIMFIPLLLECIYLMALGNVDYGPFASGFMGLYLLTGQFLAVGLLCSSLTRVQVGAAITSFAVLLGLVFVWLLGNESNPIIRGLAYISPVYHYRNFNMGVIDTRSLVYFLATASLCVFLSIRSLESRKWR
jgi:ABC-2 type transport system permease protein